MTANNPLTTAPAVSTVVPSGLLPTGTTGVTVVPIPIIWDPNAVAANGNTGDWKAIVGVDGVGMGIVIASDSVGLAKDATLTGGTAKVQVTSQPLPSSTLVAAGKATCAATDNDIAPAGGFKHISIKNLDTTNELIVTIDESSTASPTKPIYLEAGESFDDYISGSALHYSASAGSPVLKYVLR